MSYFEEIRKLLEVASQDPCTFWNYEQAVKDRVQAEEDLKELLYDNAKDILDQLERLKEMSASQAKNLTLP